MDTARFNHEHPKLAKKLADNGFFITSPVDLATIACFDRLTPVLVRCGGGRFTCPAQDARHFMDIISKSDDYVRDISLIIN